MKFTSRGEMPAHIAPVACLKQAQKNKGIKKPIKPCLLRRRRIALVYINFLLRRKAHSFFFLIQFIYKICYLAYLSWYNPMTSYTVMYNDIGNTFQELIVTCIIVLLGSMSPVSLFITPNK